MPRFEIDGGTEQVTLVVPPGQSRVHEFSGTVREIVLKGDADDFDNRVFFAVRDPADVDLMIIGRGDGKDTNDLEYYFRSAFAPSISAAS